MSKINDGKQNKLIMKRLDATVSGSDL